MELEDLESINKNDFLPLLPLNIKQELMDGGGGNVETGNICDSVEKKVDENTNAGEAVPPKCVWCSEILTAADAPKILECLHVACGRCVSSKFSELDRSISPVLHCPTCSMASQFEHIIENQFIIEQNANEDSQNSAESDAKTVIKCSSCSDDASATSWCVECSEFICDNCVQAHQRLKITKDHTIKTKEEAVVDNQLAAGTEKCLLCPVHPQEKLSLFCETCDKLTCRDCQLVDHRDHKYKFAHEIAAETRHSLSSLLNEITYKRVLLNSAMKVIDDRQNMITEKKKELVKEITDMVLKITNTVNIRGKQLVLRLNEVCDSKLKVLNEKKDALQLLSGHTDHCIDFVQSALDSGSDSAVLFSKKTLSRHLQKVKCQRADIPNPEIPVRIQVQLSQVQELQKVISQLGTIIVDGKAYPPTASPGAPRQQPSPNMIPPGMRPGIHQAASIQPTMNVVQQPGFHSSPPMYNTTPPQPQQFNIQINRPFSQDGNNSFVRFPNMGPGPHAMRQVVPHVSSSTHPQNMEISLRGLLNQGPAGQNQQHISGGYNQAPPNFNMTPAQGQRMQQMQQPHQQQQMQAANHQQQQAMRPLRPPFMQQGPPNQTFPTQPNPNQTNAFMNSGPRFQNIRMGTVQGANMQQANMRQPIMQNNDIQRFPGQQQQQQPGFVNNNHQQSQQQQQQQHGQQQQQQQTQMQMQAPAHAWHIPQSARQNNGMAGPSNLSPLMQFGNRQNENSFKISLKSPNSLKAVSINGQGMSGNVLPNVTSTNPKTPSPSTNDNAKDYTDSIDKACEESVNDLMATIAKLDSNGVQVLPEGRGKTTSPQVHSSTDLTIPADESILADKSGQKDDPNEDWCAVCLDGGELMCCDKCPKVFHQNCHIPNISSLPDESETWQCLLCVNLAELPIDPAGEKRDSGLTSNELKIIQRICLELYCQYEQSLPIREMEPITNAAYYEIITSPMCLEVIRTKLDPMYNDHYKEVNAFINDVRLIFRNVYLFYREDSKVYASIRYLDEFFEQQLAKWLPQYSGASNNSTNMANIAEEHDIYSGTSAKRIRTEEDVSLIQ